MFHMAFAVFEFNATSPAAFHLPESRKKIKGAISFGSASALLRVAVPRHMDEQICLEIERAALASRPS
jgi:hypothetical protein